MRAIRPRVKTGYVATRRVRCVDPGVPEVPTVRQQPDEDLTASPVSAEDEQAEETVRRMVEAAYT
jgi:hypothetical protein